MMTTMNSRLSVRSDLIAWRKFSKSERRRSGWATTMLDSRDGFEKHIVSASTKLPMWIWTIRSANRGRALATWARMVSAGTIIRAQRRDETDSLWTRLARELIISTIGHVQPPGEPTGQSRPALAQAMQDSGPELLQLCGQTLDAHVLHQRKIDERMREQRRRRRSHGLRVETRRTDQGHGDRFIRHTDEQMPEERRMLGEVPRRDDQGRTQRLPNSRRFASFLTHDVPLCFHSAPWPRRLFDARLELSYRKARSHTIPKARAASCTLPPCGDLASRRYVQRRCCLAIFAQARNDGLRGQTADVPFLRLESGQ